MISKVLIANRGEIACRIIRSLRELGIASVAVYSDADKKAMHVAMADEAVCVGAAPSAESYLQQQRMIAAALAYEADAIHPGYGFLSENPEFVRACDAAGIVFIGPGAEAIEAMGLKDAAKHRMEEAGVPVVPGYHGDNQDPDFLQQQAEQIGWPVLIKARAGGGGKGMRRVNSAGEFAEALAAAKREGKASFGDDRVLVEKYMTVPRHIEVQVFGDHQGNVVHLFERDCSLQRRHQKVVEEAPAPGMTESMRQAMGEAAVQAARAVNYVGAGTVEFIVDAADGLREDRFYFMEMNTRLQVEHPVTEAITGVDLVAWQIAVADGQPLPRSQDQLEITGHAMEARLYAEDTDAGFLPATGTLEHLRFDCDARIDTGVAEGDAISPWYDPMIAKVITHGRTREAAMGKLARALDKTRIAGCTTNRGFLGRLLRLPAFVSGEVVTSLIDDHPEHLARPQPPREVLLGAALMHTGMTAIAPSGHGNPWQTLQGFRNWGQPRYQVELKVEDRPFSLQVTRTGADEARITGESLDCSVVVTSRHPNRFQLAVDGGIVSIETAQSAEALHVFSEGEIWRVQFVDDVLAEGLAVDGGNHILAPMPGTLTALDVAEGDPVKKGQRLGVLEAMKMEHSLVAEQDGVVESLGVQQGDQVEAGALLIALSVSDESDQGAA